MFSHKYRLPSFVRLVNSKTINTQFFTLRKAANKLDYARFGFIISKKTAKTAVKRNGSKRLLRSCVESIQQQIKPGYDYLFIIRKNLTIQDRDELCKEINRILEQTELLK